MSEHHTRALDLSTADRLAKLVRLLGSNRDGEILGAVTAMKRILEAAGLDLHAVANRIIDGDPDAHRDAYARGYAAGLRDVMAAGAMTTAPAAGGSHEWRMMAEFCAARRHALNDRECGFIDDMVSWTRRGLQLSPKQEGWLQSIHDRLQRVS
jgi:hypothetical protein